MKVGNNCVPTFIRYIANKLIPYHRGALVFLMYVNSNDT